MQPSEERCIGAAGMGLWFLTQDKKVWSREEEPVPVSMISVFGPNTISKTILV